MFLDKKNRLYFGWVGTSESGDWISQWSNSVSLTATGSGTRREAWIRICFNIGWALAYNVVFPTTLSNVSKSIVIYLLNQIKKTFDSFVDVEVSNSSLTEDLFVLLYPFKWANESVLLCAPTAKNKSSFRSPIYNQSLITKLLNKKSTILKICNYCIGSWVDQTPERLPT